MSSGLLFLSQSNEVYGQQALSPGFKFSILNRLKCKNQSEDKCQLTVEIVYKPLRPICSTSVHWFLTHEKTSIFCEIINTISMDTIGQNVTETDQQ